AARGTVIDAALAKALAHPYFARRGPRSTGREDFGAPFAAQLLADVKGAGGSLDDAIATATALSVEPIGRALEGGPWTELAVVGTDAGGTKTRAFAVTRAGVIVGRGAGGGANLLSSPDPQGSIAAALREALAGRVPAAIVLASAGGGREADRAKGRAILTALV